jgi:hypothetical protein
VGRLTDDELTEYLRQYADVQREMKKQAKKGR